MWSSLARQCLRWFRENRAPIMILALLWALSLGINYVPSLFSDDWPVILYSCLSSEFKWVDFTNRRPLIHIPFNLLCNTIGLNIDAFHFVNYLLHVLLALFIYLLVKRYFSSKSMIPMAVALLFSIYPVDLTPIG